MVAVMAGQDTIEELTADSQGCKDEAFRIKVQKPIRSLALASASRSMYADTSEPTTRLSQLC